MSIYEMVRLAIYEFKAKQLTIKTRNNYAINVITKMWKAKKNLDILQSIDNLLNKISVKFVKVTNDQLYFPNVKELKILKVIKKVVDNHINFDFDKVKI